MKVFVSYSRLDASETAKAIHNYLTEIGHHEVFIDTSNIHDGDEWRKIIQENISNCDIFIIIVTPSALYRSEVEKEVELAKNLKKKIIPCIAKGYIEEEDIKWELNKYQGYFYESDSKLAMHLHKVIKQVSKTQSQISVEAKTEREVDKYSPMLEQQNSKKYLEKAKVFERLRQNQRALNYDEAIKIDSENFGAHFNKALLLVKIEELEKAYESIEIAIDLQPENPNVWYHKGIILEKLEKYDKALEAFKTGLQIDGKDVKSWTSKANILVKLKRYEEAVVCYDKVLAIDINNEEAIKNKKITLEVIRKERFTPIIKEIKNCYENKDYSRVIELSEEASKIFPNDPVLYLYKGYALQELERFEKAIQFYNKALEIDPNLNDASYRKSQSLQELAKYENNINRYENTKKIFVSYSRADANDFAQQIKQHLSLKYDMFTHVYTDVDSISNEEAWRNMIEKNISSCDIFVIIVTHDALRNQEVEKEVLYAQTENKKIIPCIHRDIRRDKIKWGLEKIQGIEFDKKNELARNLDSLLDIKTNIQRDKPNRKNLFGRIFKKNW